MAKVVAKEGASKRASTPEQLAAAAQRARERRAADKADRLKREAELKAKADTLPKDEAAPQPDVAAAPPTPEPAGPAAPLQGPEGDPWPTPEATSKCVEGAEALWQTVAAGLASTRYSACLAARDVTLEGVTKRVDPIKALVWPTAAVIARSNVNLGPSAMVKLNLFMIFGPTAIAHVGELAVAGVEYVRARSAAKHARVKREEPPPAAAPEPTKPPAPAAAVVLRNGGVAA